MIKSFKLLIKTAVFTLMLAVALRPVVVNVDSATLSHGGACLDALAGPPAFLSPSISQCFLSYFHVDSSFKVIAKEIVSVISLAPCFAESGLSMDSSRLPFRTCLFKAFSPRKFLVLRI